MKAYTIFIIMIFIAFGCNQEPKKTDLSNGKNSEEQLTKVAELADEFLTNETEKGFSGAVMIFEDGKPSLVKGYGKTDANQNVPIDENTLFDMGSITKSFTATAILKLEEMGKLSVNDLVAQYFEDVPKEMKDITIHHLLTHSSGLPGAIGHDYDASTEEDFLDKTWNSKLLFPIGEGYEYSNVGYSLLGMIIEKVSNETYDSFLQKNIFIPAGMNDTGYTSKGTETPKVAHGVNKEGEDWGNPRKKNWNGDSPFWHLKSNGGILTSANDMANWYEAVLENKILNNETLQKQLKGYVDEGEGTFYGYGLVEFQEGKHYGHNGGNGIFRADWNFFPEKKSGIFVVSNSANVPLFDISDDLINIMMTGELPKQISLQPVDLQRFPSSSEGKIANEFLQNIKNFNKDKSEKFIAENITKGMVERNSKDRLIQLFQQLEDEFKGAKLLGVSSGENHIELKLQGEMDLLRLMIDFLDGKIDSFGVEAGD